MCVKVKFISEVEVKVEKRLSKAAKEAGIKIDYPCDGKGKCGKCTIKVLDGNLDAPTENEVKLLGPDKLKEGYRLACQARILEDSVIETKKIKK